MQTVYSMQIKPFLNHFLRANAKNIIGSKLKLKFWTKKTILNFMNQESIQGIMNTHIK